jgi:DHA2 family lincomycin resistance protein-like MFS transporter
MKVRDIMETDLVSIHQNASYEEAVRLFHDKQITGCPVVDDQGAVVGIVSYKDLMRILFPYYDSYYRSPELYNDFEDREMKISEIRTHKISTFMSTCVYFANPDMPLLHAGGMMLAHHIHRLPVMEQGRLTGLVTRTRILRELFKKNFGLE